MYNEMRFAWNTEKNRLNQEKHGGVDFETASRIFSDPYLVLSKDRVVEGEQRWHAIGSIQDLVLLVVHVYRKDNSNGEEIIRIISARKGNQQERRIYLEQALD
jgi:uncharacterized DUF497 family protein